MNKPLVLVTAPVATRSGYGNHSRDICRALIELDKYDIKINSVRWGTTPMNALEQGNDIHKEIHKRIITNPSYSIAPIAIIPNLVNFYVFYFGYIIKIKFRPCKAYFPMLGSRFRIDL